MPVYHARAITIRLGSTPLAETTTNNVVLKKGEVSKRQSEAAEKKLLHGSYLNEKRVLFPGDPDGFELNWLGNAPFMQVQTDSGFTQSLGPYGSGQESSSGHNRPEALTLHIKLSDKAFLSGFNGRVHLKVEVLFNGQLSTCSLIHTNDIRSGAKSFHQIFAGYRVDFLAERPWVILPPFTTADGSTRRFRRTITPKERWEEVSAAILKEAEERGTDRYGESPPSAVFLHALASMEMPECVKTMQKPGGRKFGVVDVVITAGLGNKLTAGTNYLKRPQRLKDLGYAVRDEVRSYDEAVAVGPDDLQDTTVKLLDTVMPDAGNPETDAEESDTCHERSYKCRALSSAKGLSQYSSEKTNFRSPFSGAPRPFLPPPGRSTLQDSLSRTADRVSPRCPPSEHRSDGHKEPLPSNDRNLIYSMACEIGNTQEWKSDASRIFQEYHLPLLDPEMHTLQMGHANPALTSMPLSEHMTTHGAMSPFVGLSSVSSSMPQAIGYHSSSLTQSIPPGPMDTFNSTTNLAPSTPFVAPIALMLPTPPNWSAPPGAMTSPYYYPMHFQQQLRPNLHPPSLPSYMPPHGLPSLLPRTPPFYEHSGSAQFATPVLLSPPLSQLCGPLPPTAMFSVPSKPRRSASPGKGIAMNNPDACHSSVLVSRLVITGLNGMPVVDHVWEVPQPVIVNHKNGCEACVKDRAKAPVSQNEESHARSRARKQSGPRTKSSQANSRAIFPNKKPLSKTTEQYVREQRRDSVQNSQLEQATSVPLPYLKRHQRPANEDMPINPRIDVPDKIAPFVSAHELNTATPTLAPTSVHTPTTTYPIQPTALPRRTFSRNVLPSIQGPKAATFLFDDPEEVLREAARMRRSRSPVKPAATPVLSIIAPAHVEPIAGPKVQVNSSPLSSVPSSPLPERSVEGIKTLNVTPDQIPQLDGSPEHKLAATSPRKLQTFSPTKSSFAAPKLRRPGPPTPQSSVSPDSKKRKASDRSPTKPPRSPDRLKTVDNPPLNDDCVITFAESIDKEEERGILRQVKGEREGVFKEEYVMLAVRFFIAGD